MQMKLFRNIFITLTVALVLGLGASLALAQSGPDSSQQFPVGLNTISYQGRVMVNGQPFDGTGYFKFAIVDSQGNYTWNSDIIVQAQSTGQQIGEPQNPIQLPVNKGLFSVRLGAAPDMPPIPAQAVGDPDSALRVWFSADGTNFTQLPDRPFSAAPWALMADTLDGWDSSEFARSNHTHWGQSWSGSGTGLRLMSNDATGLDVRTATTSSFGSALYAETTSSTGATKGVVGLTNGSGDGAAGVWGQADSASGVTFGVYGQSQSSSDGAAGVFGSSEATSGAVSGVHGVARSSDGYGVQGYNESGVGVFGGSLTGVGVWGRQGQTSALGPIAGAGVWGDSAEHPGVWGSSVNAAGVAGLTSHEVGVAGLANQNDGIGVQGTAPVTGTVGIATNSTGQTYGVYGRTDSSGDYSSGLYGYASANSGTTYGVYGRTDSSGDYSSGLYGYASAGSGQTYGVYGVTSSIITGASGVYGEAPSLIGQIYGVYGVTLSYSPDSSGVYGEAIGGVGVMAQSANGDPIRAYGSSNTDVEFKVTNTGDVYADGTYSSPAADFAEMLPATDGLQPGDVLVVGPDGQLTRSSQPYQTSVVGVYSTQPGFLGGSADDADPTGKVPLAVVGVVPVKVSAENGAIRPGDLLTPSGTPGHAMKAEPVNVGGVEFYRPGTIIGKALESLDAGTGVIRVLITLH